MPPNHYSVLGLSPSAAQSPSFQKELRRAYKVALLGAHPDKKRSTGTTDGAQNADGAGATANERETEREKGKEASCTVDDVKEALAVLSDSTRRAEFERWLRVSGKGEGGSEDGGKKGEDFWLGLESLDLSDFEAGMPFVRMGEDGGDSRLGGDEGEGEGERVDGEEDGGEEEGEEEEEEQMTWTRKCRCGDEQGFRILERELEEAERRGEREVLVGCEGCSLWVRVGFDVEEG